MGCRCMSHGLSTVMEHAMEEPEVMEVLEDCIMLVEGVKWSHRIKHFVGVTAGGEGITEGLRRFYETRFTTSYSCLESVRRHQEVPLLQPTPQPRCSPEPYLIF